MLLVYCRQNFGSCATFLFFFHNPQLPKFCFYSQRSFKSHARWIIFEGREMRTSKVLFGCFVQFKLPKFGRFGRQRFTKPLEIAGCILRIVGQTSEVVRL